MSAAFPSASASRRLLGPLFDVVHTNFALHSRILSCLLPSHHPYPYILTDPTPCGSPFLSLSPFPPTILFGGFSLSLLPSLWFSLTPSLPHSLTPSLPLSLSLTLTRCFTIVFLSVRVERRGQHKEQTFTRSASHPLYCVATFLTFLHSTPRRTTNGKNRRPCPSLASVHPSDGHQRPYRWTTTRTCL